MNDGRKKPLPEVLPMFETEDGGFPGRIRVSFRDGSTAVYRLEKPGLNPMVKESIRIIRKWSTQTEPARRRRRRA